jgi:hypothetical protein
MQTTNRSTLSQVVGLTSSSNRAVIPKVTVIAASVLALYFQDLAIIFSDALQDEATSHILLIPLLFLYFIYRKRKMLHAVIPHENTVQPRSIRHFSARAASRTVMLFEWQAPIQKGGNVICQTLTRPLMKQGLRLA